MTETGLQRTLPQDLFGRAYCAVMAGLSRMSRPGSVSSSSATASRDFTKSEKER
jgi:hypothetical protein